MNVTRTILLTALASSILSGAVIAADQPMKDSYITTKVKAELAADTNTPSRHISVTTSHGVVALSGTVDSDTAKQKAEQDAREVKGVVDVVNKLEVKP